MTVVKIADTTSFDVVVTNDRRGQVGVATLAQFISFDTADVKRWDTSGPCVAFAALDAEYGHHEMLMGEGDYHDGAYMIFKDGSQITIKDKRG